MPSVKSRYRIKRLRVSELWDDRTFDLTFDPRINILIGPNASGKTTLLNLLYYTFGGHLLELAAIDFAHMEIELRSFDNSSTRTVRIEREEDALSVSIWRQQYTIDLSGIPRRLPARSIDRRRYLGRRVPGNEMREATQHLQSLVPAVWLPVSRRLPIPEEEDEDFYYERRHARSRDRLESVDRKLSELLTSLSRYRLQLDSQLSERYKDFEKRVLELVLYNEEQDTQPQLGPPLTGEEETQLLSAFEEAGLLTQQMQSRVVDHFTVANAALDKLHSGRPIELESWAEMSIIPLIWRTKKMVTFAQQLDVDREALFAPLHKYESIVNSFLATKHVSVDADGDLEISVSGARKGTIDPRHLSSGEKQILILLTQALLMEDEPVVYVADEPELSLHVTWQEELLASLLELGREMQIIVATHSPDIVGAFVDNVIQL